MVLNLHLLRLFAAVARHRSFSRAAEALHVSQPAVSKGVREFEAQVGARLLERGPGGVRLTEAGKRLISHAQLLFTAERAAEEELEALRGLQRGTLAVGASTTIATYLLPSLLGTFHRAHPAIELRLTSANTQAVVERLVARELDIALVEGPVTGAGIRAQPWRKDKMVLITAPDHRLALAHAPAPQAALGDEIFLIREPGSGTRNVVEAALSRSGIRPGRVLEIGSTEAIKQMVAAGLGVAFVSAASAADQIALGRLKIVPLRGFNLWRMLTRISLPARQPTAAALAFERLLEEERRRPAPGRRVAR